MLENLRMKSLILYSAKIFVYYFLTLLLISCGDSRNAVSVQSAPSTVDYQLPVDYAQHESQEKYFHTSDGNIAYIDHGDGGVLVLLHGVPTSSWLYRKIIPELQNNFRVVAIDFLGYGGSAKPEDNGQNYLAISQAEKVQALLASLEIKNYSLLMHDMGGLVAWELLRIQPEAINNLIVLNTIVNKEGFYPPDTDPGIVTRLMTKAFSNNLTSVMTLRMTFDGLGLQGKHVLTEEECKGYVLPMREGADQALYSFYTSLNDDLYARLDSNKSVFQSYQGNTLVLWGAKDKILTTEQIPLLREHLHIPAKNIHIYEENNHFLAEEIPGEVVAKVKQFLMDG